MPNHDEPPSDLHEVRARINAAISAPRVTSRITHNGVPPDTFAKRTSREPAPDLDELKALCDAANDMICIALLPYILLNLARYARSLQ